MNESVGLATVCAVLQPESAGLGREVQFSFVAQDGSASCKLVIIQPCHCIHSVFVMMVVNFFHYFSFQSGILQCSYILIVTAILMHCQV